MKQKIADGKIENTWLVERYMKEARDIVEIECRK
jgi:hypothetical protein